MMALSSELPGKQVIYGQLEGKFFPIIAATILVMMILCIILAHFMTKNLVKPIEQMAVDINDFSITPAYKELAPFAATIRAQHADILKSARMRQDFTANVSHELKHRLPPYPAMPNLWKMEWYRQKKSAALHRK